MRLIRMVAEELAAWLRALVFGMPGRVGNAARVLWCRSALKAWGQGSRLGRGCEVVGGSNISFGDGCIAGRNCFFTADGGSITIGDGVRFNMGAHVNADVGGAVSIGNNCLFGPNVVMRTASHRFTDAGILIQQQGHDIGDITIEDDVWVAAGAIILGGVTIGRGAVIGAGAVVTKSVPAMTVAVGVPAIGHRRRGRA